MPTSIYPLLIYIPKSRSCSAISSPVGNLDRAISSPFYHHLVPELFKVPLNGAHRTAAERTNPAAKLKTEMDALDVRVQGVQEEGSHERPGRNARKEALAPCKRARARVTRREVGQCCGGVGGRDVS